MFYEPNIKQTLCLGEEESQHCIQVLRANMGDVIEITDGCGTLYQAQITNPHRKHCQVQILSQSRPAPLHQGWVHIAIAPTKNIDRFEWFIEKATEMGVDEITPLLCTHSERKTINLDRLQKILIAAAKQSLCTTFPKLNPLTNYQDFITPLEEGPEDVYIAHCEDGYAASNLKHALLHCLTPGHSVVIMIGPEGDFSPDEIAWALQKGYKPVSLGNARLRTETAGLVACHTAILINE